MNFYETWLFLESLMEIPIGTTLYHGTIEDFDPKKLHVGGYDQIFWTTDDPRIARSYIPISGSYTIISAEHAYRPTQDKQIQKLQRYIGLNYDYSKVEWKNGQATSWPVPIGWSLKELGDSELKRDEKVATLLEKAGWKPVDPDVPLQRRRYRIDSKKGDINDFILPGQKSIGRLFTITVMQPLKIMDFTNNGRIEGDLTSPDYHRIKDFRQAETEGYDGVQINDWAQVGLDHENIGHTSIGIFKGSIKKLKWENEESSHPDYDPNKSWWEQ